MNEYLDFVKNNVEPWQIGVVLLMALMAFVLFNDIFG